MLILLVTSALAAPAGFKVTKNTEHCELSLGPALGNGVVPMRAECHWPDLAPEKLQGLLAAWGDHEKYFSSVVSCDVERTDGARVWTKQVHRAKGIADREAVLVMERSKIEGGYRYAWSLDNGDLVAADGNVLVGWDEGFWEFTADPNGGTRAVHQLAYDPGGSVPGFLVRWFQTSGLTAVVEEIEAYAKK
jgi:hypothetical protein